MRIGEAYEDGTSADALTFGMGTDGGYILKNEKVNLNSYLSNLIFNFFIFNTLGMFKLNPVKFD